MTIYYYIISILIIAVVFELCKLVSNQAENHKYKNIECFSNNETDYMLYKTSETEPGKIVKKEYVNRSEEVLICRQKIGTGNRVWEFNGIKIPLGEYMAIYVKKVQLNLEKKIADSKKYKFPVIKTVVIKNISIDTNLPRLLQENNVFVDVKTRIIHYYIKFLSEAEYKTELKKQQEIEKKQQDYNMCVQLNKKLGKTNTEIVFDCKKELDL